MARPVERISDHDVVLPLALRAVQEGGQAGGQRGGRLCGQGVQDSLASVSTLVSQSNVWSYSHAGNAIDHTISGWAFQDTHLSLPLRT